MASSTLPQTMSAWQGKLGGKVPRKITVPLPYLSPTSILVKIRASGVCHSDCLILSMPGPMPYWKEDFIMGHEGSGTIVSIGSSLPTVSYPFKVGQDVVILCTPGCNLPSCTECSRGHHNLCQSGENPGLGSDGVFAEYAAVKPWGIVPLPKGIPHSVACVTTDAVLTAYHAVKVAGCVERGQTVLILGLGGVGLNALQIALFLRVKRVLVVDKRRQVLDKAVELGVARDDAILADGDVKVEEKVVREGIVVDCAIDFVGMQATFMSAQLSVRSAGIVTLVGLFADQLSIVSLVAVTKAIRFQCSYNGTREELMECLRLVAEGHIKPSIQTGSFDDLPKVLEDLDGGKVQSRMVLMPPS